MRKSAAEVKAELSGQLDAEIRRLGATNALFVHAVASRLGLNPTDYECLDVLDWTGPITAGQLAQHLGLTSGAVSGMLDRLEIAGWVQRNRDAADKRKVVVTLLRTRFAEVAPLYDGSNRAIEEITTRLSAAEMKAVISALATMNDAFASEAIRLRVEQHTRVPGRVAKPRRA